MISQLSFEPTFEKIEARFFRKFFHVTLKNSYLVDSFYQDAKELHLLATLLFVGRDFIEKFGGCLQVSKNLRKNVDEKLFKSHFCNLTP